VSAVSFPTAPAGTAPTAGATAGDAERAPSTVASPTLLDRDAFLKLLVAQLRYQDPTKPLDPTEMVSQTAQLSVVDKLEEISRQLEQSAAADRLAIAGTIVGSQVAFEGEDGQPTSAVVRWVRFDGDAIVLGTDRWEVPLDAVVAVSGPPATTSPTTTSPTTTNPTPSSPTPSSPTPTTPSA
jgi:flagellar basal-body rod modification protein FlgD